MSPAVSLWDLVLVGREQGSEGVSPSFVVVLDLVEVLVVLHLHFHILSGVQELGGSDGGAVLCVQPEHDPASGIVVSDWKLSQ